MEKIQVLGQREREAKPAILCVSTAKLHCAFIAPGERRESDDLEPSAGFLALYRLLLVISGPTS